MEQNLIIISADGISVEAELKGSDIAKIISDALPIVSVCRTWGEEIYFDSPVSPAMQNPVDSVGMGDIAYWGQGPAVCLFFGETPISSGGKIIPAGPVEIIGKILSPLQELAEIKAGSKITVKRKGE